MKTRAATGSQVVLHAAIVVMVIVVSASTSSARVTKTCLTGTAPEVANDSTDIRAVRALIDASCVCANFDGSKKKTHVNYVACAANVIKTEAAAGHLRTECKGTVRVYYSNSTCGVNPSMQVEPCISTSVKSGKISCAIKPTKKRNGTPSTACASTVPTTRVLCPAYTTCIDAADTNGNLIIGAPGDSGACVLRQGDSCSDVTNCASHHCTDGVCCDTACTGVCQACSAALTGGAAGLCVPVTAGTDPHNDCPDDGAATCDQTGACNGAGACALYSASTVCTLATCNGLTYNPPDLCNGSGSCVDSGSSNCNDGNVCTDDACSSVTGCSHVNNTAVCNAGACNGLGGLTYNPPDMCNGGACVDAGTTNCNDGNVCTDDACSPTTGCSHVNNTAACSAPFCIGMIYLPADQCSGGNCIDSGSINCNDGNVCTTDSCSSAGCGHVNNTASCDDGAACTVSDTCSGGACAGTQLNAHLHAAITEEIDSVPDANDRIHLSVEITTVTDLPFQLTVTGLDFPTGFSLESLSTQCSAEATDYRCRHTAMLLATSACRDDGNYHMYLTYNCSPDVASCNLCSAPERIDFTLHNSNFCSTTVVSTCGNNQVDPGELCDGASLNGATCQSLGFFGGTLACAADCSFNTSACRTSRAFVTSTTYNGSLGGLAGADAKCQARAGAASLGGNWTAWLSTSAVDAKDRIPGVEYRLVDNTTVVCTDQSDLLDGSPDANIDKNEFGASSNPNVWTGTNSNGTKTASTCSDWSSTGGLGLYGANDFPVSSMVWSFRSTDACSDSNLRLYCFEQLPYKRVFISSNTTNGNLGGLSGADASCQARAAAAHLGGTWKAWLSTSTVNAKDRIPDAEYRLVDRSTIVANNKADLIDGSIDANINKDEFGAVRVPDAWTGTSGAGTVIANEICNDWTSAAISAQGWQGKDDFPPSSGQWTSYGGVDCDVASLHVYCFEQ